MNITMDRYEADGRLWSAGGIPRARRSARVRSTTQAVTALRGERPNSSIRTCRVRVSPVAPIAAGDAVVMFNFAASLRFEISRAFERHVPQVRSRAPSRGLYAGMMEYDGDLPHPEALPCRTAGIERPMGESSPRRTSRSRDLRDQSMAT